MSKKKFKAGLESLFGDMGDDQLPGIRDLLVEEQEEERMVENPVKKPKKRSSKNFTSNLDDLFHNALDKEFVEKREKAPMPRGRDTATKKRNLRPIIGIDALIRRTSGDNPDGFSVNTPLKKRVTLTLEKQKIEHLKNIAKSKKSYLKDVVDEIISDYLREHPEEQNNSN